MVFPSHPTADICNGNSTDCSTPVDSVSKNTIFPRSNADLIRSFVILISVVSANVIFVRILGSFGQNHFAGENFLTK